LRELTFFFLGYQQNVLVYQLLWYILKSRIMYCFFKVNPSKTQSCYTFINSGTEIDFIVEIQVVLLETE